MTLRAEPAVSEAGFTLLEVLVVLVIMGVAAGLLLQRGPFRSPALNLRAAAAEFGRTLRQARLEAITTARPVLVGVDVPGHAYAVAGGPVHRLPEAFALNLVSVAPGATGQATAIGFAPDGSSSGGRLALAQGGARVQVSVAWLTGRITVSPVEASDAR